MPRFLSAGLTVTVCLFCFNALRALRCGCGRLVVLFFLIDGRLSSNNYFVVST